MSGTTSYNPPIADLVIECYERCGIRNTPLTAEHFRSARRSMNLVQSRWANRGVNLWKVSLQNVQLNQGQGVYSVDASTVDVLDTYLRQFQMGAPTNYAPQFTTTLNSTAVTIAGLATTPLAGSFISVIIPVSVGGLIISGFYEVVSVPSSSSCTIAATSVATASVTLGGAVPTFTTASNSTSVVVALNNHGLLAGQTFTVQITTVVGGLSLLGGYPVATVINANSFTITAPNPAGSVQTVAENNGQAQIAVQAVIQGFTQNADPTDILLYPLSRNEYAAIPDKAQQGRPTSYWFNRSPATGPMSLNLWLVPDGNGPYQLFYYVFTRIFDAEPASGGLTDVPFRMYEAWAAEVAAHLSIKWQPTAFNTLNAIAKECWIEASDEDREKVSLRVSPEFGAYFD